MELNKIKKVEVVRYTEKVNKMLADGWVLLKICENYDFLLGTENPEAEVPEPDSKYADLV